MLLQGEYGYADYYNPTSLAREIRDEVETGKIVASFSDGSRLYTHAGLRSSVRDAVLDESETKTLIDFLANGGLNRLSDQLNSIFVSSLKNGRLESHPIFFVDVEKGGHDPFGGIFWCDFSLLADSRGAYKIPQIFGHTPTRRSSVNVRRNGKLIDIDAGMYEGYGGNRVYLEIGPSGEVSQHSEKETGWEKKLLIDVPQGVREPNTGK